MMETQAGTRGPYDALMWPMSATIDVRETFAIRGGDLLASHVSYRAVPVRQSTFKAGLTERVHRWFRLTPSFGPDLVRQMLEHVQCESHHTVLDPFAGAGTTLIEARSRGLRSFGFELNPVLHFVCETSLEWSLDTQTLEECLDEIERQFRALAPRLTLGNLDEHGLTVPSIHNPLRWWREDVLLELLALKKAVLGCSPDRRVRAFFTLALAAVLVPQLSNVTLGRLQLHFIDRTADDINVWQAFFEHANAMVFDIHELQLHEASPAASVHRIDSTDLAQFSPEKLADIVVTSPPYPNRYSYVWNTRPHLYFLDFLSNAKQASDLDKRTIGGTWGTATSMIARGRVTGAFPIVTAVIEPVVDAIRQHDNLMANYAMKYFNLLAKHIVAMEPMLNRRARLAYVVGCSRLKDVFVETDVLLGQMLEGLGLGYRVTGIERIRRRHSGADLHESIVYAERDARAVEA